MNSTRSRLVLFAFAFLEILCFNSANSGCSENQKQLQRYNNNGYNSYYTTVLDLKCNNVTLFDISFTRSLEIDVLDISNSDIKYLPHAAFSKLTGISKLYMQNLNIMTIRPAVFLGHSNIKEIYFDGNRLSSVTDGIYNALVDLTKLDLSRNNIETISDLAFAGTSLIYLNLSRNAIKQLGSSLEHVPTLKVLDISLNSLRDIDNMTGMALNVLKVNDNKITYLNMAHIQNVKSLDASRNRIQSLTSPNPDIEEFNIGDNVLKSVDVKWFENCTKLRKLYINGNDISIIPNNLFHNVIKLTELDLSNNSLLSFDYGTFDGLAELESLNVSYNSLTTLPGAFHSLGNLTNLYLQYNKIYDLKVEDIFDGMFNIKVINIDGNYWGCMELRNITIQLRKQGIKIINGHYKAGKQIFGMSCYDDFSENPNQMDPEYIAFPNGEFRNSTFYRFFGDDFPNTTFAKYFQKFSGEGSTSLDNNFIDVLQKIEDTLENITKTNDSKYKSITHIMEIIRNNKTDNSRKNTVLDDFLATLKNNTELNNTKYVRFREFLEDYLKKLQDSNKNIVGVLGKLSAYLENELSKQKNVTNYSETAQKYRGQHDDKLEYRDDYRFFAIFSVILLTIILLIISAIGYVFIFKTRYNNLENSIQLSHLMQT